VSDTSDDQPCWRRHTQAVGKALATDFVPDRLRASGIGWYNATLGLLGLVASVVAGLLWDHVSHAAVFLYGAAFAIAGSIALMALVPAMQIRRPT
jgi:MFS family permease